MLPISFLLTFDLFKNRYGSYRVDIPTSNSTDGYTNHRRYNTESARQSIQVHRTGKSPPTSYAGRDEAAHVAGDHRSEDDRSELRRPRRRQGPEHSEHDAHRTEVGEAA